MSVLKRTAYYLGGFGIGLILLYFFVSGSGASCEYDYGPSSRTLKNIRNKDRFYSEASLETLKQHQVDTSAISNLLLDGSVLFSESNTKLDSCKIYVIECDIKLMEQEHFSKTIKITVENCAKKVIVQKVLFINE